MGRCKEEELVRKPIQKRSGEDEHANGNLQEERTPLLRVYLFQGGRLEWREPSAEQENTWKSHTIARAIFLLLLCAPNRQSLRGKLLNIFWGEKDEEKARESLRSMLKGLRTMLALPRGEEVLETTHNGEVLKLKGQEVIWVDADAFEALVQQASRETDPYRALSLWQEAHDLLCGDFLAEDVLQEWANSRVIKVRHHTLQVARRRMVRSLADLYIQLGHNVEAEELLSGHVIRFPADQDALYRLMKLLIKAECFEEARSYYEQAKVALAAYGKQPAEYLKRLEAYLIAQSRKMVKEWQTEQYKGVSDPRAQDFYEVLQTKQMHQERATTNIVEASNSLLADTALDSDKHNETRDHFSHAITQGIIEAVRELEGAENLNPSRRRLLQQTLPLLFGISGAIVGAPITGIPTSIDNDSVSFYASAIPSCWSLVYNKGIEHVEKVLPTYLARLITFTQQSSQYRKEAANLASQGYKLANLLDLRREDFGAALQHSKDAMFYGQIAEDPNLQVAALIEEALTFWYRKRHPQTLASYQKALQLTDNARELSPIIKGRIYAGLGVAYAAHGQKQEALRHIGLAYDTFPEHPEEDPHFSYTHYSHYYLYLYEGLMYTNLGQPKNALEAYAHFHVPEYASRRTEIVNREAAAWLTLGDLDQCSANVEAGATLALSAGSELRYSEAREVYQGMSLQWPHEQKVKSLVQLFQ
jgi:DNA-binding SARP family transcriptional activator